MKILLANKFYYLKGGAERHFFDLKELLEKHNNQVIPFSMQDEKNITSEYSKYFVSNVDIGKSSFSPGGIKAAGRIIYSFEAKKKIRELINKTKPDIAHIHNIYHQISPSILTALRKAQIPIVMTVHDFKLMCPNYIFYTQGKICERCKKYRYYNCVLHKCVKNSYLASKINMIEMYWHRFLKIYKKNIDLYICPSQFVKDKLIDFGFNKDKITVLPHFIKQSSNIEQNYYSDNYILYFGRLSKEKGVNILLEAAKELKYKDIKVKIAGTGPAEKELKGYVKEQGLEKVVEFLGFLEKDKLNKAISSSLFTIMPSLSYETFGLSVLESYMQKKPVIASNLGALPELVLEGKTGMLFQSENSTDLALKIKSMLSDKHKLLKISQNAKKFSYKFNRDDYYRKLEEIYIKLCA